MKKNPPNLPSSSKIRDVTNGSKRENTDSIQSPAKKSRIDGKSMVCKISKTKVSHQNQGQTETICPPEWDKFGLYLTKVTGRASKMKEISFGGLMRLYPNLESAVHFNYMIDLDFVLKNHPNQAKMLLVSGDLLFSPSDNVPKVYKIKFYLNYLNDFFFI